MTLFQESGLSFQFEPSWIIQQYDAHRYYSYLSGAGLKAVDFIGIQENTAYLFEVKNYSIRFEGESFYKIYELIEDPEQLVQLITAKVFDTQRGVKIVHDYLSRKFFYRHLYPWYIRGNLPAWAKTTWWFWAKLYHLWYESQQAVFVLWIEVDPAYEGYDATRVSNFLAQLRQRLETELPALGVRFAMARMSNGVEIQGVKVREEF